MNKTKLTRQEKRWILYDVGNSAFTMLVATILPIYFNGIAGAAGLTEVEYLAYWGYAASIATLIVVFIGPVLGTLTDTKGLKKPIFITSIAIGIAALIALSIPKHWLVFLAVFVIAKVGYNCSLIFYDSMLVDITTKERMDMVSSNGYAWGYIGSCIPFVASLIVVLLHENFGLTMTMAMTIAFCINGVWWLLCSLPLLKHYEQVYYADTSKHNSIKNSFGRLYATLTDIKKDKNIFFFLLAFFFFIDGVYTIIEMATAYGSALGLDSTGLLLALLLTQVVAFPCALIFSRLSRTYKTEKLLKICIIAYTGIAFFAVQLDKQWEFWLLAFMVGIFQGAIQALSRSYFTKIIPAEKSGEFFGIYDICGKGASFVGTTLVGVVAQITGIPNAGVAAVSVLFIVGFVLFCKAAVMNREIVSLSEQGKK